MKALVTFLFMICFVGRSSHASAQVQYTAKDSTIVMNLLQKAVASKQKRNVFLFFARSLEGTPYVAQTLEHNEQEQLVVNLREVDCTTYVEYVLALTLCHCNNKPTFAAFCDYLRRIRYINGQISYTTRQHYFTIWIEGNRKNGYVTEIQAPDPPFTQTQTIAVDYMSNHPEKYPMLAKHKKLIESIKQLERGCNGAVYKYIPKTAVANTPLFRHTVRNGDILALVTKKKGLDTTHIGIAVWHKDGLHLLNASSIRKKVVDETIPLKTYMQKQTSQIGIRVIRVLP